MKTLLVVEDDDAFREMLRTVLELRGFNVLVADGPATGLAIARHHTLDGVITDLHMPRINGLEFCRALRVQNDRENRPLPIWIMSGSVTLTLAEALNAGAHGVFRKPFHVTEISKVIERHLSAATQDVSSPGMTGTHGR